MIPVPQFGMMFEFPVGGISGWVRGYAMKAPVEGALSLQPIVAPRPGTNLLPGTALR